MMIKDKRLTGFVKKLEVRLILYILKWERGIFFVIVAHLFFELAASFTTIVIILFLHAKVFGNKVTIDLEAQQDQAFAKNIQHEGKQGQYKKQATQRMRKSILLQRLRSYGLEKKLMKEGDT